MIVDISRALSGQVNTIEFNRESDNLISEVDCVEPVKIKGTLKIEEQSLNIMVEVELKVKTTCSRCLEDFIYPMRVHITEDLNLTDELEIIQNSNLDLTELLRENILINIPFKPLCTPHCRGLCPICGSNRNLNECNCDSGDRDPRLAVLENLLSRYE